MPRRLIKREGIWHYYRRIPRRFGDVDSRKFITLSLETRDLSRAIKLQGTVEREVEALWVSLKQGESEDARERYVGAIERARLEDFEYRPAAQLAEGDIAEVFARVRRLEELFPDAGDQEDVDPAEAPVAAALLGTSTMPELTLSKALPEFLKVTRDKLRKKSPDQLRRAAEGHWQPHRPHRRQAT